MASFFGPDANQQADQAVKFMRERGQNPVQYGFTGTQQERDSWGQGVQALRSGANSQQTSQPQASTAAPKASGGQSAPNMSAWSNQGGGGFNAWQTPSTSTTNPGFISQFGQQTTMDMSNFGNMANQQRPQVDQSQQWAQQMAQMQSSMNQRAAALAQVLDQGGIYKTAGALNQNIGRPQYDPQSIMQNANSMVLSGWQNPLQNVAAPPDPVSNLFASYGMTAPPGFMDQLLGLLGQQAPPQQFGPAINSIQPQFDQFAAPAAGGAEDRRGSASRMGDGYDARQMTRIADQSATAPLQAAPAGNVEEMRRMEEERWMANESKMRAERMAYEQSMRNKAAEEGLPPQTPSTATPVPTTPTGDTYPSTTPSLPPPPANTQRPQSQGTPYQRERAARAEANRQRESEFTRPTPDTVNGKRIFQQLYRTGDVLAAAAANDPWEAARKAAYYGEIPEDLVEGVALYGSMAKRQYAPQQDGSWPPKIDKEDQGRRQDAILRAVEAEPNGSLARALRYFGSDMETLKQNQIWREQDRRQAEFLARLNTTTRAPQPKKRR